MEQSIEVTDNSIKLSERSIEALSETRKWAHFLSILGFIGIGLMVIFGIIGGIAGTMSAFGGGALIALVYIILAGLYSIPVYYLFMFSSELRDAIENSQTYSLDSAFEFLKSHYKFIGIFTIVILSLYLLIFIGSMAFML
ncbi:MAG: DUF5362 family protein [Bacteroidales bacterium]|nr:DUF5362 family protein [Bacteroidales bacterium]